MTLSEIKRISLSNGQSFFKYSTLIYFNRRVISTILKNKYFVISDFLPDIDGCKRPQLFLCSFTGEIVDIVGGPFQNIKEAKKHIKQIKYK